MENLVDYLIVLFFVISFLSSFFKKKKKTVSTTANSAKQHPAAKLQRENVRENKIAVNGNRTKKKSPFEDILKSMLEVPEPAAVKEKSEVDAYYDEALKNSAMMEKGMYKEETSVVEDTSLRAGIEFQENQNTYLNTIKEHHKKNGNKKAMKIRKDLFNDQTIKKYIIMSEILGKPMALRE